MPKARSTHRSSAARESVLTGAQITANALKEDLPTPFQSYASILHHEPSHGRGLLAVDVYEAGAARFAALSLENVVLGGGGGYGLVAALEGEPFAVVEDPEVQVELGPAGEGVKDALLSDHGRYRRVRVLVPVPQSLPRGDVPPPVLAQAEAVRLDVVCQVPVVGDVGELDLHLREDAVEREPLQKVAVLQLVQEAARGEGRVHGDPAPELHDLGVDHLDA